MSDVVSGAVANPTTSSRSSSSPLVGGLNGLRELMKMQQNQNFSNSDTKSNAAQNISSGTDDKPKRKRRRGGRSKASKAIKVDLPLPIDLPFNVADIVYGEITRNSEGVVDVVLYVDTKGRLLIYSKDVFNDERDLYLQSASTMLSRAVNFSRLEVDNVIVYVNDKKSIRVDGEDLVYADKYQIVNANQRIRQEVINMLNSNKSTPAKEKDSSDKSKIEETIELHGHGGSKEVESNDISKQNEDASDGLIDKILRIKAISDRTDKNNIAASDLMEAFLVVEKASTAVANDLLGIEYEMADSLIDQLRRMRALGVKQSDDTYPILINSMDDLGGDIDYNLQTQADNFRSAVHTEIVRGKRLVYDLGEVFMVKMADEYIEQLAMYCRESKNSALKKLFADAIGVVKASDVLRCVSSDVDANGLNVAEYDLFHSYVTKYMISAGWLINNPSDGFPWVQLDVEGTEGLKLDTVKYVVVNLGWIAAMYDEMSLNSLREQIARLEFTDNFRNSLGIKEFALHKIDEMISLFNNIAKISSNQLSLSDSDNKESDSKNRKTSSGK